MKSVIKDPKKGLTTAAIIGFLFIVALMFLAAAVRGPSVTGNYAPDGTPFRGPSSPPPGL